jgi:non-specific serine/threonine protein kinase
MDAVPQADTSRISYRYRFGTAEFDEAQRELRVAGLRVEVEPRALEVLLCLLRRAGEVVTKEELFAEVWSGRVTVDKVLPVAVAKLRRALGETNAGLLHTQARVGYRLTGVTERTAVGQKLTSDLQLAPGRPVPGRSNFMLRRQLGSAPGGEVWLAEHAKTRALRVYKFAGDDERLRALKREVTLLRLLEESVIDHSHLVDLIDWNFEHPPFFLECAWGGENMLEWSKHSLPALSRDDVLQLFLQIADTVAAAHAIGVLHKDLKPANVLVDGDQTPALIRLTDFGSGHLLDPKRLDEAGITAGGFTMTQGGMANASIGTPLYVAPELFSGQAPTVQNDVYALGIMLYQLLGGDLTRPMASGWEQDVGDELLCEDIRLATDGNPARRLSSATELAVRLRGLDQRRADLAERRAIERRAQDAQQALARSRARRPYLVALVAVLVAGVIATLWLYGAALSARDDARHEFERATALNRFFDGLLNSSNPFVAANGANTTVKEVLLGARNRVSSQFDSLPATEASIRTSLAESFYSVDLASEAESEIRRALALHEHAKDASSPQALRARSDLVRILLRRSKADTARDELMALDRLCAGRSNSQVRYPFARAWFAYYFYHGEFAKALPLLEEAIRLAPEVDPGNIGVFNALHIDLIAVYQQTNQPKNAEAEADKLIKAMSSRGEEEGLTLALVKFNLARVYARAAKYEEALRLLDDAKTVVARTMGTGSESYGFILANLAEAEAGQRDWPQAFQYANEAYGVFSRKYGVEHYASRVAEAALGEVLYAMTDAHAALPKLAAAYPALAKIQPQETEALYAGLYLCMAQIDLDKLEEASSLLAELEHSARDAARWKLPLDAVKGMLIAKQGDRQQAVLLLESAADGLAQKSIREAVLGEKARDRLSTLRKTGITVPPSH